MIAVSMSAFDASLERALFDSSNPETIATQLERHLERLGMSVVGTSPSSAYGTCNECSVPSVRRNIAAALHAFIEAAHDVAVIGLGAPVAVNAAVDPLWPA